MPFLLDAAMPAGQNEAPFDPTGIPSGTTLYRLMTLAGVYSKTIVLL